MTPTNILKHEHKVVLMIVDAAEREVRAMESGQPLDGEKIGRMVDFFRTFVDRCHHVKEERHLFPKMQERSPNACSVPISVLLEEHKEGRRLVAAIAEGMAACEHDDSGAAGLLQADIIAYVDLMRAHTDKEDNVVFPLADRILRPADLEALVAEFDRIEAEELGEGVHERYHQLAHELAEGGGA
jgi:hemerythrin-like domain-containing protein